MKAKLDDIKRLLTEISRKLDELLEEKEIAAMMKLERCSRSVSVYRSFSVKAQASTRFTRRR